MAFQGAKDRASPMSSTAHLEILPEASRLWIISPRGDERSCELVGLLHFDLMVAGICIKEGQGLASRSGVNNLIDSR